MKERAPQRQRLTRKQRALVKAKVKDPTASLSKLGVEAGYTSAQHTHRALNAPVVQNELAKVRSLMDEREKLSLGALLTHIEDGLETTEIKALKLEGSKVTVKTEVKDMKTRGAWWDRAMELRGLRRSDQEPAQSGPINIAIILAGGGSDAEKTAVADALLAARIARGLHISENRMMTPEELSDLRRTP